MLLLAFVADLHEPVVAARQRQNRVCCRSWALEDRGKNLPEDASRNYLQGHGGVAASEGKRGEDRPALPGERTYQLRSPNADADCTINRGGGNDGSQLLIRDEGSGLSKRLLGKAELSRASRPSTLCP